MKKARKIKINGVEYKYFLDIGASIDEWHAGVGETYSKVILYQLDGNIVGWWNGTMQSVTKPEVKQALKDGKFFSVGGRLRM